MTGGTNIETVHANMIDSKRIYYYCNYCLKSHSHGNMDELGNYIHHRGSHCTAPGAPTDVKIIVDGNTKRFKKGKSIK